MQHLDSIILYCTLFCFYEKKVRQTVHKSYVFHSYNLCVIKKYSMGRLHNAYRNNLPCTVHADKLELHTNFLETRN